MELRVTGISVQNEEVFQSSFVSLSKSLAASWNVSVPQFSAISNGRGNRMPGEHFRNGIYPDVYTTPSLSPKGIAAPRKMGLRPGRRKNIPLLPTETSARCLIP